jgi:hypothetical protein
MPQKKNRGHLALREQGTKKKNIQTQDTRSSKNKYKASDSNEDSDDSSSGDNVVVNSPRKTRSKKVIVF